MRIRNATARSIQVGDRIDGERVEQSITVPAAGVTILTLRSQFGERRVPLYSSQRIRGRVLR